MTALTAPERRRTKRRQSYEEYLALPHDGRIVEWVDGEIISHIPATQLHQNVASLIETLLRLYVTRLRLGRVFDAPFEVRLWAGGPSREPDVLFIGREQLEQLTERRFEGGPTLVVEVVSPGSVTIDRVDKFLVYERAGLGEYWVIDPRPHQQQCEYYVRDEKPGVFPVRRMLSALKKIVLSFCVFLIQLHNLSQCFTAKHPSRPDCPTRQDITGPMNTEIYPAKSNHPGQNNRDRHDIKF